MSPTGGRLTAADLAEERSALVATLREAGPDAATLAGTWNAADLAAHVAATEKLRGVPTFLGRMLVVRAGWRLNDVLRPAMAVDLRRFRRKGFDWALARLERPSPRLLARPAVLPMSFFEIYVHHEDVRRPNGLDRAAPGPDLRPCIAWLLTYHRSLLAGTGVRVRVRLPDGTELHGSLPGPTLTVSGPAGDVLLWLAGRRSATTGTVTVTADDPATLAAADRLHV